MENKILEIIYNLNIRRIEAEEDGNLQLAEKLLTASQTLKEVYL